VKLVAYLELVACVGYPENPQDRTTLYIVTYPPKTKEAPPWHARTRFSYRLEPSKPRRFTKPAGAPESIGDYAARRGFLP
jgi:hypothetical protein